MWYDASGDKDPSIAFSTIIETRLSFIPTVRRLSMPIYFSIQVFLLPLTLQTMWLGVRASTKPCTFNSVRSYDARASPRRQRFRTRSRHKFSLRNTRSPTHEPLKPNFVLYLTLLYPLRASWRRFVFEETIKEELVAVEYKNHHDVLRGQHKATQHIILSTKPNLTFRQSEAGVILTRQEYFHSSA